MRSTAGVKTSITIQDKLSNKVAQMAKTVERLEARMKRMDIACQKSGAAAGKAFRDTGKEAKKAAETIEQVGRAERDAANGAKKIHRAWSGIGGLVASALTAFGAKKILDVSDGMTQTTARLNLINDGSQTTDTLQKMIYVSAQRSRGDFMATADAVSKMGLLAGDAFGSNAEVIAFMEQVNKQFAIAGTSAEGRSAALLQLTQAMGAGVLRGEELNSVFEQAPTIIQSIAKYLDVPIGKIREMAQEGEITAGIVKAALLSTAEETNAKFDRMPKTFAQIWAKIKNQAIMAFRPALEKLSELVNSEKFTKFIDNVIQALQSIGNAALNVMEGIVAVTNWIADNWSIVQPVLAGIAAGLIAASIAQWAMNLAMLASPITWIIIAVVALVAALVAWIAACGGVEAWWLDMCDQVIYAWDILCVAWNVGAHNVLTLWELLQLGFQTAAVNIQNWMGDMKTGVLLILQDMVNGAIGVINSFIAVLNQIPGVSIEAIASVTFGTEAQLENEIAKRQRIQELEAARDNNRQSFLDRGRELDAQIRKTVQDHVDRRKEIEEKKAAAQSVDALQSIADLLMGGNAQLGNIGSVGEIKSDVNIADEDIQLMKDVAEMRYVQNFVTLTPSVAMNASISQTVDVDEVMDAMERRLEEEFVSAAEGVYS